MASLSSEILNGGFYSLPIDHLILPLQEDGVYNHRFWGSSVMKLVQYAAQLTA